MKTLFISLAFFLLAEKDLSTTNKSSLKNEKGMITLEELIDFRGEPASEIERLLKLRSWKEGTNVSKTRGERSWVLTNTKATLHYYPAGNNDQAFEAPYLILTINSEDMYDELMEEAEGLDLSECIDEKHEQGAAIEYHLFNNENDILFSESLGEDIKKYYVRVAGKKKK